jgi:hypothetical protein
MSQQLYVKMGKQLHVLLTNFENLAKLNIFSPYFFLFLLTSFLASKLVILSSKWHRATSSFAIRAVLR